MPNSTAFITRSAMKSKAVAGKSFASGWTTRSNATSMPIWPAPGKTRSAGLTASSSREVGPKSVGQQSLGSALIQ